MRILVVQESDWMERGPHQSHHLMERLSKRGHEIIVIDFEILWREKKNKSLISGRKIFKGVHKSIHDGKVTVIRPSIVQLPIIEYLSLVYTHQREIQSQIAKFKPDVIIGFGILNANIAQRLAKKNCIPFVYYIIDELHRLVPYKAFQALAKIIESHNMKNADKVISINEGLREYTIKMGAAEGKTEVIRAGVDLERFVSEGREEIRKGYGILDGDLVLFFMGWLYDFSGLKEVALELARCKNDNIKLLVVGRGNLWGTLQDIRKKCGLEKKLIMVDWIPYEDVPKYLSASDICILPAHNNDVMKNIVPIKMYEYMASGKPVFSSQIYGIMKEFGEGNGVFYNKNPRDFLDLAIEFKENNSLDQAGYRSREFVKRQSWDDLVDMFESNLTVIVYGPIK